MCIVCYFYVSVLVGVIVKVILQNVRCNNKENFFMFVDKDWRTLGLTVTGLARVY